MEVMTYTPCRTGTRDIPGAILDPLEKDRPDDECIITTRRAITRVALVAVETGGRFEREGIKYDPMSWMLASRELFDGRSAIDACLERDHCMRSILVHGLSLGLDLAPAAVDILLAENDEEGGFHQPRRQSGQRRAGVRRTSLAGPRLFSATISYSDHSVMLQAFHASIAIDASEVAKRLCERFGHMAAYEADIREGFHRSAPVALALVQEPLAEMIRRIEQDAGHPIHSAFAVTVEQRIEV